MSSHDFTIAVYLSIVMCGVALALLSRRPGSRVPTFGALMSWVESTRTRRVGVIVAWAWLGLHFFAR
jgi:Family of unknown function (DUF6186)